MTPATWIAAGLWREISAEFKKPIFQHVLTILVHHRPRGFPMRGQQVSDTQAAIELGRVEGYNNCLDLFLSLANPPAVNQEPIESDYGVSDGTTD